MKLRSGQIVPVMLFVLVAIALLALVNVNFFLGVRSKNRLMNAVDMASIAAAKHQGYLLNQIGLMNRQHLLAMMGDGEWTAENEQDLREIVAKRPLECGMAAKMAAADWGFSDVEVEPGYLELDDTIRCEPFMNQGFYDAIAARAWCWFAQNGRRNCLDYDPAGTVPEYEENENLGNCEQYSLHVTFKSWNETAWYDQSLEGLTEDWTNFICRVTGKSEQDIKNSPLLSDSAQLWAFYDSTWERKWSDTFSPDNDFPIAGPVKAVYDVVGCSAQCRIYGKIPDIMHEESNRELMVTAEAKPFGVVEDMEGNDAPVTAFNSFIIPSNPGEDRIFTEAQLVVFGSVPHVNAVSTEHEWQEFYKNEFPAYLSRGADALSSGNYYSQQLKYFSDGDNRSDIKRWLNENEGTCAPCEPGGEEKKGGYPCAH